MVMVLQRSLISLRIREIRARGWEMMSVMSPQLREHSPEV